MGPPPFGELRDRETGPLAQLGDQRWLAPADSTFCDACTGRSSFHRQYTRSSQSGPVVRARPRWQALWPRAGSPFDRWRINNASLELGQLLDLGEAEAIALAEQLDARFLLIDEAAGRKIARRRGVPLTGVAGVILSAKASGAVDAVRPIIEEMSNAGYRLSPGLVSGVLARTGE